MLIDSHCHLNRLDLADFNHDLAQVMALADAASVKHMLTVCVELNDVPELAAIAERFANVHFSVGVHPDSEQTIEEPTAVQLIQLADHPACISIGETGLDYYRTLTEGAREVQRQRFREHIRAARHTEKPLIIHTRQAADDTLRILKEEEAAEIGGVMHCFTEDWSVAERAMELNFYISFSGIVSFKNALTLQEVAKRVPADRMLIETDAPYLAPVPFRGKQNQPAFVKYVAEAVAKIRETEYATIAQQTTNNFYRCFRVAQS